MFSIFTKPLTWIISSFALKCKYLNLFLSTLTGTCCSCCLLRRYICQLQAGHGNCFADSRDSVVDNQRIHAFWSTRCREPGFWSFDGNARWKEAFVLISMAVPALNLCSLNFFWSNVWSGVDSTYLLDTLASFGIDDWIRHYRNFSLLILLFWGGLELMNFPFLTFSL